MMLKFEPLQQKNEAYQDGVDDRPFVEVWRARIQGPLPFIKIGVEIHRRVRLNATIEFFGDHDHYVVSECDLAEMIEDYFTLGEFGLHNDALIALRDKLNELIEQ